MVDEFRTVPSAGRHASGSVRRGVGVAAGGPQPRHSPSARGRWRLEEGGGGCGIRTHGTIAGTTVFETVPIDHSGTPPLGLVAKRADNRRIPTRVKPAGRPGRTRHTPSPPPAWPLHSPRILGELGPF